ncbi:importin subunit alpha-like [Teleopsis dalmanni]|uniref:importin subunit alpha-like n=1 Tax=Teleopsis dalmanni TaxID=139649 RepID=UPI0018CF9B82|nr:importin subunit alpha-like [Teleopsis dalmanni]
MSKSVSNHETSYKSNTLNFQEFRNRRHQVTIELRKSKKEHQINERRNINENEALPVKEDNEESSAIRMTVEEMLHALHSDDKKQQLIGFQEVRNILDCEQNQANAIMISNSVVPVCVKMLQDNSQPMLQFEAAWVLANIISGTTEQIMSVIQYNAVPHLINLLKSKVPIHVELAAWTLAVIASNSAVTRNIVINHDIIDSLLPLLVNEIPISLLRIIVWLISNLCCNINTSPPFENIRQLLPLLSQLLYISDKQVLSNVCFALSFITTNDKLKIQAVIDAGVVPRLIDILDCEENTITIPALRTIGNIVTGTDAQTDEVIKAEILPKLVGLLQHENKLVVKDAAWIVSNLTAGNQNQIQAVLNADLFTYIRHILEQNDFDCKIEAALAVSNTIAMGSPEQIMYMLNEYQLLKPFTDLLKAQDADTILIVLCALGKIFKLYESVDDLKRLCITLEEINGLDKIEALQQHENECIYKKANDFIDTYFCNDRDDCSND